MMTVKEKIESTLRATGRENIEKVITYMEKRGYFTVLCNNHHCYQGGMADHAWQTYQLALKHNQGHDTNSIAICALLHDFCDCYGMNHIHHHGSRSAKMLKELGLNLSTEEYLAIRYHMGLKHKEHHTLYEQALHCALRRLITKCDHQSAALIRGSEID